MKLNFGSVTRTAVLGAALLLATPWCSATQFGISRKAGHGKLNGVASRRQPDLKSSWSVVPRGGSGSSPVATGDAVSSTSVGDMVVSAVKGLTSYMEGPKADTLLLLLTTALNTPLCKMLGTSPILGFLALGVLFGPNGFSWIKDIHTTEST
jgi:hypothetical protein